MVIEFLDCKHHEDRGPHLLALPYVDLTRLPHRRENVFTYVCSVTSKV